MTYGFIHSRRTTVARICFLLSVEAACENIDVIIQLGVTIDIRKIKGFIGSESRSIREGNSGTPFLIWGKERKVVENYLGWDEELQYKGIGKEEG